MLQKHDRLPCLPTLPLAQLAATPPTLYKSSSIWVEAVDDADWLLIVSNLCCEQIGQDLTKSYPRRDKIACNETEELY